jgi:hypothetical protein
MVEHEFVTVRPLTTLLGLPSRGHETVPETAIANVPSNDG